MNRCVYGFERALRVSPALDVVGLPEGRLREDDAAVAGGPMQPGLEMAVGGPPGDGHRFVEPRVQQVEATSGDLERETEVDIDRADRRSVRRRRPSARPRRPQGLAPLRPCPGCTFVGRWSSSSSIGPSRVAAAGRAPADATAARTVRPAAHHGPIWRDSTEHGKIRRLPLDRPSVGMARHPGIDS